MNFGALPTAGGGSQEVNMTDRVLCGYLKVMAFLWRDLKTEMSYKLVFAGQLLGNMFQLGIFFFVSRTFTGVFSQYLEPYGNDYFAFVLSGMALTSFIFQGVSKFPRAIRQAQLEGTIEVSFSTNTSSSAIAIGSSLWPMVWAMAETMFFFLAGIFLFQAELRINDPFGVVMILALTAVIHAAVGVLGACFVVLYKRGNPISNIFSMSSLMLGGVFYPTSALPDWVSDLSAFIPMTHATLGMRKALLMSPESAGVNAEIGYLLGFAVVLVPLGLLCFQWAIKRAQMYGTLSHY